MRKPFSTMRPRRRSGSCTADPTRCRAGAGRRRATRIASRARVAQSGRQRRHPRAECATVEPVICMCRVQASAVHRGSMVSHVERRHGRRRLSAARRAALRRRRPGRLPCARRRAGWRRRWPGRESSRRRRCDRRGRPAPPGRARRRGRSRAPHARPSACCRWWRPCARAPGGCGSRSASRRVSSVRRSASRLT